MDPLSSHSASRLKAIIDTAIDGIITISNRGVIETANPATAKIFGYSEGELIGNNIKMLMPEPDHSLHDQYLDNYQKTGIAKIIGIGREVVGKKKDGTLFPFLLSISEVVLDDRVIYTGIVHDISKLKHAETALSETENKFNAIIDNAVEAMISIDERGLMEMVNPAAARLFGYTKDEMLGQNVKMLMPDPERSEHDGYLSNYRNTNHKKIIGIGREVTAMRKDGSTFPIVLSVSEVKLYNRRIFTGILHDLSEQKLAQEKLRRYAAELERSNRELQDFAYVSSHDLQEPLRKIQAFGSMVRAEESDKLSADGKEYVDRMLNAAFRMQKLINDLLDFSRITSQSKPFEKVDLNMIFKEVLSDLEIAIKETGAEITADKLPVIEAEPTQMRQLFQNLISNAMKFRKEGEQPKIAITTKYIQKQAHLVATPGDEMVQLIFQDNGVGFDEKYVEKIFNIFQRLQGHKYEGSGIGLSICRKIATRHGGNITAKSKPGEGATFIVTMSTKQIREEAVGNRQ
ncbi:MAG: PAS domain S-box protein [Bacteroidetes bacterium]|nr:PAS domain S-box protein [Bacteroidota bacterium]